MPTNPRTLSELITPCSLNTKTPLSSLQGGSPSLQGLSPLCSPLPVKAIKASLYYFTQNSVTSEQKLSFCNSIIKVYSEQLFASKMNNLEVMDRFLGINNLHKKENTDQNPWVKIDSKIPNKMLLN